MKVVVDSTVATRPQQELKRTNGCASVSYGTKAPGFDLLKRAYAYPKRDVLHPLHRKSLAAACQRLVRALATISNHRGRGSLARPPSLPTQAGCTQAGFHDWNHTQKHMGYTPPCICL